MPRRSLALVALTVLSFQAKAANDLPVLDSGAVPYVGGKGRAAYADFLLMDVPRVFAVAPDGSTGWSHNDAGLDASRAEAIRNCAKNGAQGCAVYAEDLRVVWPGRESADPPAPPGPLLQNDVFAIVPDPRYIWRGPQAARGLYVWGHGKSGSNADARGFQPPSYVRAFNNAGFDVVRFDREPAHDYPDAAADWLRTALRTLRGQGWRRIVVGGQSRGSWNALQVLSEPGLADDVIAVSPANFGGPLASDNLATLYGIIHAASSPNTRVAVAQFREDIFVKDLDKRAGVLRDGLQPRVAAFLLIDQPQGLTGHGAGNSAAFALRFGNCLLHFVIDAVPQAACE